MRSYRERRHRARDINVQRNQINIPPRSIYYKINTNTIRRFNVSLMNRYPINKLKNVCESVAKTSKNTVVLYRSLARPSEPDF